MIWDIALIHCSQGAIISFTKDILYCSYNFLPVWPNNWASPKYTIVICQQFTTFPPT